MSDVRPTKRHFEYLDTLRETGVTNMFGAAKWLANAFTMPLDEAREILSQWMTTFDPSKSVEERIKQTRGRT